MADDLPVWSSRNTSDMWIIGLIQAVLFTIPVWITRIPVAVPANWLTSHSQYLFQLRLLNVVFPKLAQSPWVGTIEGSTLTQNQLFFMGGVNGLFGLFIGWLVYQMADNWLSRFVSIMGAWMVWVSLLWVFAKASSLA